MKKKILIGSIIAVAIIVLSSFSSVVAKVSTENELVEFEVEFCGLGSKHTVKLSQQEVDEVNLLFVELQKNLEATASKEERNTIITQAVLELDNYGLLGSVHSEQAQKLVLREYANDKAIQPFETLSHENSLQENQNNFFCFVSGTVYDGYATGQLGMIGVIIALLGAFVFIIGFLDVIGVLLMVMSDIIVTFFPLSVMQSITIFSANITSLGLFGLINHGIPPHSGTGKIFGFNGIKLTNIDSGEINLLGFALAVIDFSND